MKFCNQYIYSSTEVSGKFQEHLVNTMIVDELVMRGDMQHQQKDKVWLFVNTPGHVEAGKLQEN